MKSNLQRFFLIVALVVTFFAISFLPDIETEANSDVTVDRELNLGYVKIYRFTADEIEHFSNRQLEVVLHSYAALYFSMNMYFTRNMFAVDIAKVYPTDLLVPVYQGISNLTLEQRKLRVRRLHLNPDGVSLENLQLKNEIEPLLRAADNADGPEFLVTPQQIMMAYADKMGIEKEKFSFLPNPEMTELQTHLELKAGRSWFAFVLVGFITFVAGFLLAHLFRRKSV